MTAGAANESENADPPPSPLVVWSRHPPLEKSRTRSDVSLMHNWQSRCSFTFPVLVTYFVVSLPLLCLIRRFSTSHGTFWAEPGPREGDGGGRSLTYTLCVRLMKGGKKKCSFPARYASARDREFRKRTAGQSKRIANEGQGRV